MTFRNKLALSILLFIVAVSIISFYTSKTSIYAVIISRNVPRTRSSFSCHNGTNFSHLNVQKFEQCLKWRRNDAFWAVDSIRHKAFQKLLNSSSLIVEIGGNTGFDTSRFVSLYNCSIISFEPLPEMSKSLMKKFRTNPKVEIQPYGLGNHARTVEIERAGNQNEGTSIFRKLSSKNSTKIQSIQLLDFVQTIENIRKTKTSNGIIDMISMNCEGCEFEVLPALVLSNLAQYIRIIQFGSHMEVFRESSCIYCQIQQALEKTHKVVYQYTMLWEAWAIQTNFSSNT
ncbi:unnamed protein product [Adineta ricciae]|uniref:Methyltransferase FkbM domain-containing protein n=2 Tax=Adineta ricciae TaxID=249248 RepID=A0A814FXQ7_ADIRI|nr:unnamed protein product [Adineta ricciae]